MGDKVRGHQHTGKSKERIGLGSHADTDQTAFRFVIDLSLPVVHLVLLGNRKVALNTALGVEELDLGPTFDEAVGNLQFRLKFPS